MGTMPFFYSNLAAEGKLADGGCWSCWEFFKKAVAARTINIPANILLDNDEALQCHFMADDAFAMTSSLLKTYRSAEIVNPQKREFSTIIHAL